MAADGVERKVPVQALHESESKYRFLFENMMDGFAYHKVLFDDHGKPVDYIYLEVNGAFEKMTGLKKENVVGRKVTQVIPGIEHDKAGWIEIYGRVTLTGEPVRFENYSETLKRWFAVTAYSPESPYFATVFEDITERKNAEEALRESERRLRESEERARNLIAHAPTPIYETDITGTRFLSVNDTVCELSGYSREEFFAMSPMDVVDQASKVVFLDRVRRKLAGEEVNEGIEYKVTAKDGRELILEASNVSFSYRNGKPESVLVVGHDVTERKRVEEALRASERRTQEILESISDGFWAVDSQWRFTYLNKRAAMNLGFQASDLIGKNLWDTLPIICNTAYELYYRKVMAERSPCSFEMAGVLTGRWYSLSVYPTGDGISVYWLDVTERKQTEESLQQVRVDLERAQEVGRIGWWRLDMQRNVLTWSDENHRIFGIPKGSPLNYETFLQTVHPDDRQDVDSKWNAALRGEPYDIEHRIMVGAQVKWVREKAYVEFDATGNLRGGFGITQDISDRKHAEAALARTVTQLETLLATAPVGFCHLDRDLRFLMINDRLAEINGLPVAAHLGKTVGEVVPSLLPAVQEVTARILATGEAVVGHEFSGETPLQSGVTRYWSESWYPVREDGHVTGFGVVIEEITERKAAEAELERVHMLLAEGQKLAHLGSFEYIAATGETIWSEEEFRIYGLEPGQCSPSFAELMQKYFHPDDAARVDQKYSETLRPGSLSEIEHRIVRPDGSVRNLYNVAKPYFDATGKLSKYIGATLDITEQKQAEEALRNAHAELEERVKERTSELSEAIQRLRAENMLRERLEKTLRESETQVRFFASQCLTAQETERKRVAGELHDSIAASIAAVRLRIERMAQANQRDLGSTDSLQEIASTVAEIIAEVRRIMVDLRPSILDDLGIIAAISWFCREFQKTYPQISVEKQIGIEEREVPDSLKTPIFRICQEAMNNSAKHSRGSLVNVSLQKDGEKILLTLQDNGQGFDLEKGRKGMGLSTIRERAAFSGGSAEYQSEIGKGTTIRVSWPV